MRILSSGVVAGLLCGVLLLGTAGTAAAAGKPAVTATSRATGQVGAIAAAAVNPTASVISLTPGLTGFDNIGADGSGTLSCLSGAGYSFDVIDALGTGWDAEYRSAAALGMSVLLFQGFYQPFWSDPNQGTARGQLMVGNARSVGYPQGAQVFLNLENNLTDGTSPVSRATMIQWVQNWAAAVTAAGYSAGVYVGVPQSLTSTDLESSLTNVGVFWRSASGTAPQTSRGYVLRQPSISLSACGVTIDADTSAADAHGTGLVGAGFPRSAGAPADAGALGALTPARIADTRFAGGPIAAYTSRTLQILGAGGVPASAVSAVVLNLTVTDTTAAGYLTAYPSDTTPPNASNLNFVPGQTVPNLVVVPVGADGTIQIYNGAAGSVDVVADVAGYYLAGTPTAAGTLGALTPARILDTRFDSNGPVPGVSGRALRVTGQGGVPATGVSAVVVNLTVTDAAGSGYITAFPSGVNRPNASNLNFVAGQTVPNLVVVPVGADGKIVLFNGSGAAVALVVDVVGYVAG